MYKSLRYCFTEKELRFNTVIDLVKPDKVLTDAVVSLGNKEFYDILSKLRELEKETGKFAVVTLLKRGIFGKSVFNILLACARDIGVLYRCLVNNSIPSFIVAEVDYMSVCGAIGGRHEYCYRVLSDSDIRIGVKPSDAIISAKDYNLYKDFYRLQQKLRPANVRNNILRLFESALTRILHYLKFCGVSGSRVSIFEKEGYTYIDCGRNGFVKVSKKVYEVAGFLEKVSEGDWRGALYQAIYQINYMEFPIYSISFPAGDYSFSGFDVSISTEERGSYCFDIV